MWGWDWINCLEVPWDFQSMKCMHCFSFSNLPNVNSNQLSAQALCWALGRERGCTESITCQGLTTGTHTITAYSSLRQIPLMQGQRRKPSVTGMINFDCSDSGRLHKQIEFESALDIGFWQAETGGKTNSGRWNGINKGVKVWSFCPK